MPINISQIELPLRDTTNEYFAGTDELGRPGLELEIAPLCKFCEIEMAGEHEENIIEKGLITVSMFDDGLSRDRFQFMAAKNNDIHSTSDCDHQRSKPKHEVSRSLENYNAEVKNQ